MNSTVDQPGVLYPSGDTKIFFENEEELVSFLKDPHFKQIVGKNIVNPDRSRHVRIVGIFDWTSFGDDATKTFCDFLNTDVSLYFDRCIFIGSLQFLRCEFGNIYFTNCQFIDPVLNRKPQPYQSLYVGSCHFNKIVFRKCILTNDLVISQTHSPQLEIETVSAPWIHLGGISYANTCELKIQNFSGGTIAFPIENKFLSIISDRNSINHFEKGVGKITVYL